MDFFSKHNRMANNLFDSLEKFLESNEAEIRKSGEKKYSLFFRQEFIEVYKTPGNSYTLSINNKAYDVSSFLSKKIWKLLDRSYNKNRLGVDNLEKKFKIEGSKKSSNEIS